MTTPVYRWADHPNMPPRPAQHFTTYWATMPNPLAAKDAEEAFSQLVRRNVLVQVLVRPRQAAETEGGSGDG